MKNLFKKLSILGIITLTMTGFISLISPVSVQAASNGNRNLGDCSNVFLGLTSWDCGMIENVTNEDDLKSNIWRIAANVATDITVIAAYLVLGYVIYGGYLYVFSGGEPGKVATGKKALYQAFLGLAIVMSANIIMTGIRVALVGNNTLCNADVSSCVTPEGMVENAIQWVIGIAGVISAIFVVYGGISYTTSAGDPSKLQKAKNMITYALIGLAIVALAEVITAFVSSQIQKANDDASYINQKAISKEVYEKNS